MAKEVVPRVRAYLSKSKLDFGSKWEIDGKSVDSVIDNVMAFYNANRVDMNRDANYYYGVKNSVERLRRAEGFWCEDIIRAWIDMFHNYIASAVYLDAYHGTNGNEKAKYKIAEDRLVVYQKTFA
jgi:hypothetical protein